LLVDNFVDPHFSWSLGYSILICAKKIISESGLFIFKQDCRFRGNHSSESFIGVSMLITADKRYNNAAISADNYGHV
jgi:hypothetical protein